jgi:hypothetical protein
MSIANKFIKRAEPLLSVTIGGIRTATSYLTPRNDSIETLRRYLALVVNPLLSPLGRPLVTECHDEDYAFTANVNADKVEWAITERYQRNLTSTRKYRVIDGEREWADGSWVYDPDDTEWQHHVYLFDNGDGTCDVYGHKEPSAEFDPYGHVTADQLHGDPDGLARGELERRNINFS